jgi:hypothetical protein
MLNNLPDVMQENATANISKDGYALLVPFFGSLLEIAFSTNPLIQATHVDVCLSKLDVSCIPLLIFFKGCDMLY